MLRKGVVRINILSDFHHAGLYNSLLMLFEGRLGGEVYRPIGMEWYEQGFWNVYPHIDTAKQYLSLDQLYMPVDGAPPLNQIVKDEDGVYHCHDIDSHETNKAISLDKFKEMQFDILIASIPQHIEPFQRLIQLYQPQAKLIFQIGNAWNVPQGIGVKNVMASAIVPNVPQGVNFVSYHQEFDTKVFSPSPIPTTKKIYSFVNCLGIADLFKPDWELFLELERLMPDWEFKSFGGQCRDGAIRGDEAIANKMREATFIFHCKTGGDGYGHVIHTAAAVGRPLITRAADYQGKLAEPLIGDAITSLIVDGRSPSDIAEIIRIDAVETMGFNISRKFKQVVDFNKEEQEIRTFLDRLQ